MLITKRVIVAILVLLAFQVLPLQGQKMDADLFPQPATFTTLITMPRAIEGLTGDNGENLYLGGSGTLPCPIFKVNLYRPSLTVVGNVPAALANVCTFRGIAFDAAGNLFVADPTLGRITRLRLMPPLRPMRLFLPVACQAPTDWRLTVTGIFGLAMGPRGSGESGKSPARTPTVPLGEW